jgi:hypothetical protein
VQQRNIINELKDQARRLAESIDNEQIKPEDTLYWRAAEVIERLGDMNLWSGGSPE